MKYDRLGVEFLKIAAFLYVARFITAALTVPGIKNWDYDKFKYLYTFIGAELTYLAITSAIIGVLMIIVAFIQSHKTDNQ